MAAKQALFMSAGVLSAGMAGVVAAFQIGLPFAHFGAIEAAPAPRFQALNATTTQETKK